MTAGFDTPGRTDRGFADALSGPDGTGDPAVLMPVLSVYPDALSAPMPDAMVALPPIDPAALTRAALAAGSIAAPAVPVQPARTTRPPGQRAAGQPGRPGRTSTPARAPAAWGPVDPRASAPHLSARQPPMPRPPSSSASSSHPGAAASGVSSTVSAWANRAMTPAEVAGFLRNTLTGNPQIGSTSAMAANRHQPAAHAPTPPLPRRTPRTTRRNKGSGVWAVFIFLVVIAFASGLGQRIIQAITELLNR